jgi:thiol:disulfide interchange protein DsbD
MSEASESGLMRGVLGVMLALLLAFGSPALQAADDFLEPEAAFRFSARLAAPDRVEVKFIIADGYYMYRERFSFAAEGADLAATELPAGKVKYDPTFKKDMEVYRASVTIGLPVKAAGPFLLKVVSQGCADKGLCYAPMESAVRLNTGAGGLLEAARGMLPGNAAIDRPGTSAMSVPGGPVAAMPALPAESEVGKIEAALKGGSLAVIIPLFVLLGLGLAFTPCVLPMVPILSFIIVGEGPAIRRSRGFVLSLSYSLGMALVYTALGVGAGLIGEGLSASLQHPWILAGFAIAMVVLSLSMFDLYQLQMPAVVQTWLARLSESRRNGKLAGVFAMGALSAVIVGPCVAAPLAAALLYISQTRDVVIGGSALFSLAAGMSIPLLLIGLSAGALLPRAGPWMNAVKRFFGVLMLGLAIWMAGPLLPAGVQMLAWGVLGIGYGCWLLWNGASGWQGRAAGVLIALLGALQVAGGASGSKDPLAPLSHLRAGAASEHVTFQRIRSVAELDQALSRNAGKIAMLDFYADWCISCKEMERFTFSDPQVREKLSSMLLLQADVTANNADDKALLRRFGLFGPPGIIFFDRAGHEVPLRVIGYQNAEKFRQSLAQLPSS